ncbi:GNAT family N-acetyltransferase [Demequina sp. TTPB684]|uniref:GNAT family N-acetyltransferase n=1 Tax=unclassified Demequina TaxID=2620311 RepID=UPI001CF4B581|nr:MULTISPECIES: GNAT family protein [unclassified Demequina]MCB2412431.1 GNAT family N-acetyltransferase [Demequina sp. TTPB684]UPU87413.1 GNAT family N-acetyltransferase [Demequina sp. TMPB413]
MRFGEPRLERDGVKLRLLRPRDEQEWIGLRERNREWLRPWEASSPPGAHDAPLSFRAYVRRERASWRARRSFPFVIERDGALVGRASLGRIEWGPERGGTLGYWVSQRVAGQGIAPAAVVLLSEFAFAEGLHRIEIAIRPENEASLAVAHKLELREEGMRSSYLFIDGAWRDHRIFAVTANEKRTGTWWTGAVENP